MPCPGAAGAGGHSKCAVLPHAVIQAVANLQGNAILRSWSVGGASLYCALVSCPVSLLLVSAVGLLEGRESWISSKSSGHVLNEQKGWSKLRSLCYVLYTDRIGYFTGESPSKATASRGLSSVSCGPLSPVPPNPGVVFSFQSEWEGEEFSTWREEAVALSSPCQSFTVLSIVTTSVNLPQSFPLPAGANSR